MGVIASGTSRAGQLPATAFQIYNAATASSIIAGPFALYTVSVDQLAPTQLNLGFNEVDKKADGFNIVTTPAGPVSLATALAALDNSANLLSSIEPVVIGPGGVLYQTDGHHTFRALTDSGYGTSNPTVYVNVIANFSNMTEAQFLQAMESDNLLFPVNDGVFDPVNLNTGAPLPSSLLGMTSDPYRGLEYSILKNKSSKLFTTTANITGAVGSAIPGLDKITGFYSDFIWADAYRGANNGLGLPFLSPADIALATQWNLTGSNVTTNIPGVGTISVQQLPGYILPANQATINPGVVTNASLTNANPELGALSGDGTFDGLRYMTVGGGGQSVTIGTQQAAGTGPGFLLELGNDNNTKFLNDTDSVTLNAGNTYTGGTTIIAGRLIIMADSSLGAAAGPAPISTNSIAAGVEADNGIVFNSLTEGNGTIQLGSSATPGQNSMTLTRPIAVDGEVATFNLNSNVLFLNSPLYSVGALSSGISNAAGDSDITIDDATNNANAEGKLILGTAANPNFYGNWIIGNNGSPVFEVFNDASLGNTAGPSYEIGQIELNGGTLQAGASFSSVRSLFLGGGSQYDTNGFNTTWTGTLQDTQRTILIGNSGSTPGSVGFGTFSINSTAILGVNAGNVIGTASTTGGAGTTVTLGSILRGNNFANSAPNATLFINPSTGSALGQSGTNGVEVFAGGAAATLTDGIVPAWIVTDNGGSAASNPYDFLTYSAANGYQSATAAGNIYTTTFGASNVVKFSTSASINSSAAYALNVQNGKTLTINAGQMLTVGDGVDPAGLILEGTGTITGGTLAFGAGEAVIDVKATNTISSAVTGTGGLTLSGSGTLVLSGTAGGLSGPINVESGTLQLSTANFFNSGTTLWLSNVKSKPSNAILQISANETLSGLDSDGSNAAVNIAAGDTLTIGDTATNWNSTLSATITGTTTGSLVKAGSGLLDISGSGGATFGAGGTVSVTGGALRIANGIFGTSATTPIAVSAGAELQYSGNGGSQFHDPVTGAGIFHLLAGTVQLTSTGNTYTGGTVIELGATLDATTANLPTGGTIINAGGIIDFDQGITSTFSGVISDGIEAGGPGDLNDMSLGSCTNGSSANPQGPACLAGNFIKDDSSSTAITATDNLTLTGINTYSGYTAIEAGTLTLGVANAIANSSGVDLGRVGGSVNALGAGENYVATLALGANNTINGLSSEANNAVLVALNGNNLVINQSANTTYYGDISDTGTATLMKVGTGLLALDGTSTVKGSTVISGGGLQIGDATHQNALLIDPTVTVGASGTLLGHGTINGAVTNTAGGTVQPGGSIGVLSVVGSYTQSASTLAIELNPIQSSTLVVSGTPGTASIAGTLALMPDAGFYDRGVSYQLLTASGGVSGTFSTITNTSPQYLFSPTYKANEIDLMLTGFAPTTTLTANERGVFNALENAPLGSATDSLLDIVGNLTGAAQTQALMELNSFSAASNISVVSVGVSSFQEAVGGRASADPGAGADVKTAQLVTDDWLPIAASRFTVWSQGLGQFGTLHGTSAAPGETSAVGGGVVGIDTALDSATRVGAVVGATAGGVSVQNVGQSGTINSYALGLYGGRWFGPLGFDAEVVGDYNSSTSSRFIAITGATAKGSTSGFGGGVSGAARYRIDLPLATVEPQLGFEYAHNGLAGYGESGAGVADLKVGATSQDSFRSAAGAEVFRSFSDPDGYTIVPELRAAWLHQFLDTTPTVNEAFAATPSATFSTTGINAGRDAALLEAGLAFKAPGSNVSFYVQYDATLSSRELDHTVRGGLAINW